MTNDEMISALGRTLEDHRLSRTEREELLKVFETMRDRVGRQELRRLALAAARAGLANAAEAAVVDWLEGVLKVLDRLEHQESAPVPAEAHFSPGESCWSRIVQLIDAARARLDICVFTITDDRISRAIIAAARRGLAVRIITDNEKAADEGSDIEWLRNEGLPLRVDRSPYHMHHKFALFDGALLLSGSYNWTRGAALNNNENIIVTADSRLIAAFVRTFDHLWTSLE